MILTHGANSLERGGGGQTANIGGREYRIVEMPDGNIWMAENLVYDDGQSGITSNSAHPEYGLYYNQDAAIRVVNSLSGWHLPSMGDFENLAELAGVVNIKSTSGWNDDANGTDLYGFALFPFGYSSNGSTFTDIGDTANLWNSNNYGSTGRCAYVYKNNTQLVLSVWTSNMCNVRLVKDAT